MTNSLNKAFTGAISLALLVIAVGRIPFSRVKELQINAGSTTQCT